mmetsp:Transcript_19005/g.48643  ORF Transcript_19005/g.48643 Transcript_19005/m.48643 type:complete len:404 (+) Transcript_19005:92-1303(+)
MTDADRNYLSAQNLEQKISDALAIVLREKPKDGAGRMAELLSAGPFAADHYLQTIGRTPLVRLDKMIPIGCKACIFAKMEMQNPGGSIKDRIALNIIDEAEKSGKLKPGMILVEATSGNTGIGLAMVAAAKGYKCIVCMPQVPSMLERYMIARMYGAEVHLTAAGLGAKGLLEYYENLCESDRDVYFPTDQFNNPHNPEAHEKTTGPEVWAQTSGEVDIFIHGIGTGGCLAGAGKFLKAQKPSVKIIGIEPTEARVHVGAPPAPHMTVGIGAGIVSNFLSMPDGQALPDPMPIDGVIDEWQHANGSEAIEYAKRACTLEGMMVGPSAGAALKVALEVGMRPESEGKTIVVILASHGIRYTAHPMWTDIKREAAAALPTPPILDVDVDVCQWKSEEAPSDLRAS